MSSSPENLAVTPPRPTVFISYASEDRAAARLLRDTLITAGLDVWYDENELGGGDAWDQKIRRQIRDCDYFMPVVSATTERRKEGYFSPDYALEIVKGGSAVAIFLNMASIHGRFARGREIFNTR